MRILGIELSLMLQIVTFTLNFLNSFVKLIANYLVYYINMDISQKFSIFMLLKTIYQLLF